MKDINEIRDWLLNNAVDTDGDLMLNGLDFSEFEGRVYLENMRVKNSLYFCSAKANMIDQSYQVAKENIYQHNNKADVIISNNNEEIEKNEDWCIVIETKKRAEMTQSQIEEKLGYRIEIVEE